MQGFISIHAQLDGPLQIEIHQQHKIKIFQMLA